MAINGVTVGTVGSYIQHILHSLVLIFYPKGGGGWGVKKTNVRKTILSHFMFSSRFMLFPTFLENKFLRGGGGGQNKQNFVVLASEPVGGRSRATEFFLVSLYFHKHF